MHGSPFISGKGERMVEMKGTFPKPSKQKGDLLAAHMAKFTADKRTMFGAPVYFVKGNMFAGIFGEQVFSRFAVKDREELAKDFQATTFEPVKGRKMLEYMVLPESLISDNDEFDAWLDRSFTYVNALPQKKAKK